MLEPAAPTIALELAAPLGVQGLGARIEVPVSRAIVSRWRPAILGLDGIWRVELDRPITAGAYQAAWRTGDAEPPGFELIVPLTIVPQAGVLQPAYVHQVAG